MSVPTRLANKTQWALQDSIIIMGRMEGKLKKAIARAEEKHDPMLVLELTRMHIDLVKADRVVRSALRGEYDEKDRENNGIK